MQGKYSFYVVNGVVCNCDIKFPHKIVVPWWENYPNSIVHGANMEPIWGRQDPGGIHVGPMNFAIWVSVNSEWIYIQLER